MRVFGVGFALGNWGGGYKAVIASKPAPTRDGSAKELLGRLAGDEARDAMATEKLAEGIRQFARDQEKLEALLQAKL